MCRRAGLGCILNSFYSLAGKLTLIKHLYSPLIIVNYLVKCLIMLFMVLILKVDKVVQQYDIKANKIDMAIKFVP